jgi:hypothetical protein
MDLTIHLHSWMLPTSITVALIIAVWIISLRDDKDLPIVTSFAGVGALITALIVWDMWAAMTFVH